MGIEHRTLGQEVKAYVVVRSGSALGAADVQAWVGAALAPDVDLLFRFADGRNHHNYETHSVGCAIAAGLLALAAAKLQGWTRPGRLAIAAGFGWLSHVLLDYLNRDTTPPIGIMALWPFDGGFYKFPHPLFLDIGRTLTWATAGHDALAAVWEVVVLTPLLLGVLWLRKGRVD